MNSWKRHSRHGCTESHHRINLVSLHISISILSKRDAFFPARARRGRGELLLHSLATPRSPRNRTERPQSQSKVINFSRLTFTPFDFHHYFHTNRSNYWALIRGTHEHHTPHTRVIVRLRFADARAHAVYFCCDSCLGGSERNHNHSALGAPQRQSRRRRTAGGGGEEGIFERKRKKF